MSFQSQLTTICCDRATWTKSSAVIGYPSGQDTRCVPQENIPQKACDKSLIDQIGPLRWLDIDLLIFLAISWTSTPFWSINVPKKEHGQYPAILTSRVVNNPNLFDKETLTSKYFKIFQNIWWKEHSVEEDLLTCPMSIAGLMLLPTSITISVRRIYSIQNYKRSSCRNYGNDRE